jgi:magnesium chelatase family protein
VVVSELSHDGSAESSITIRQRVSAARVKQARRLHADGLFTNAQLKPRHLKKYCSIDEQGKKLLEQAVDRLGLSARAYGRILRVARTIADLADSERLEPPTSLRLFNTGAWIVYFRYRRLSEIRDHHEIALV